MEGNTILNPNPLVKFLNKPQKEFTKADIIRYQFSLCRSRRTIENTELHY